MAGIVDTLKGLAQLDIDAVNAYEQALGNINVPSIHERIDDFRRDHQRHVENLSAAINRLGGDPPSPSRDVKGFMIEGFTALRSAMGIEGALKAMQTNEELTNKNYDKALSEDLPTDVRTLVERNREDERRHLDYIVRTLQSRAWEERPTPM